MKPKVLPFPLDKSAADHMDMMFDLGEPMGLFMPHQRAKWVVGYAMKPRKDGQGDFDLEFFYEKDDARIWLQETPVSGEN